MTIHISFNGKDISEYGLTALDGTLAAFMTPFENKPLVKNENSAMNGTNYLLSSTRKVKETSVNVPFLMHADSLIDQTRIINTLRDALISGKNESGMNEVYVAELATTYYLIYSNYNKFSNFGLDGSCFVNIKFIEPNPANRKID